MQVRRCLDMMAGHSDDIPKNIQTSQGEQDDNPNSLPMLFSFLPDPPTFQLVLAGMMQL